MPLYLQERMTFDKLFRISEPRRVYRSFTVKGPPLEIDSYQDVVYYIFNFKANPSTTGLRHRGYIKFFKPKNKNPNNVPLQHLECLVDCTCFSGDALVLMQGGVYRKIKDVKVGDYVYTHKGRLRKVTCVNPRAVKPTESVYEIEVAGFTNKLVVTGEHPFYTLRGNDVCLCGCGQPLYGTSTTKSEKQMASVWSPDLMLGKKYRKGHYRGIRGQVPVNNEKGVFTWIPVNAFRPKEWFLSPWIEAGTVHVDTDFARLVGYYAAEGCIPNKNGHAVRLTFNANETSTLVADALHICAKLGYKAKAKKAKQGEWVNVTILNPSFKIFCKTNVGEGSNSKQLSATVLEWDNEALKNVYTGMALGDGWCDPEKGTIYTSINHDLVSQAALILSRLRVRNHIQFHNKETADRNASFKVSIPRGSSADLVRSWLRPYQREKDTRTVDSERPTHDIGYWRDEGQLKALQSREKISYSGLVYDITVEEDESFIVNGIAVHNCPDFRYRWAWANKQRQSSVVGPQSLNQAWNKAPRKTNPKGAPGLCKHILAARRFIYGLLSSFPGETKDTAEKLNHLTKYATKRWTDFEGQMQAAKAKEAEFRRRRDMRNIGQLPQAAPTDLPGLEEPPAEDDETPTEQTPDSISAPKSMPNDKKPKSMGAMNKMQPEPLPTAEVPKKPVGAGANKSTSSRIQTTQKSKAPAENKPKRVLGNRVVTPPKPGNNGWIRPEHSSLCEPLRNFIMDSVVNSNGNIMNSLKDAIKLVEEMETDELDHLQAEPSSSGIDSATRPATCQSAERLSNRANRR